MNFNTAVIFDSCVLYPAPLRDLLLELAGGAQDLNWFRAKWTDEIHDEWIRNLLANRPDLSRQSLGRTKSLMNRHIDDCLVTGYEHRIESLALPDQNDRHVLAGAIECGATIIVTANIDDFPAEFLLSSGIKAMSADDFICDLLETYEEAAEKLLEEAVRNIKRRLSNPAMSWSQYLNCLASMDGNELTKTVECLRAMLLIEEIIADDLLFATNE